MNDEQLRRVLVDGPKPVRVVLAECDPGWPARFAEHRDRIVAALGERARLVEHVGSTAVPGLAAKDRVDILVAVDDPEDEAAYLPDLLAAGYLLAVHDEDHRALRTPSREVNVHVWPEGHPEIGKLLAFRDRLRADDADRLRYEQTKRRLAGREWPDVNYYAEAKGEVIHAILARAGCRE